MNLYKGVFWYVPSDTMLITKKVSCDENGVAIAEVEYTSKSRDNFNHKIEWESFSKSITRGYPYNYYPRGRVEINNKRATIYLHPAICTNLVIRLIYAEFGLEDNYIKVRAVSDESSHYKCYSLTLL